MTFLKHSVGRGGYRLMLMACSAIMLLGVSARGMTGMPQIGPTARALLQWSLKVQPDPRIEDPRAAGLQRELAAALNASAMQPPPARIDYFGELYNENTSWIEGWGGVIDEVKPVRGGYIVSIRVRPRQSLSFVSHYIIESYVVTRQGARFLGASPPPPGTPNLILGV